MAQVHTAYGPGEVVETNTVRGRTEYRVAGNGFNVWLDETKIAGIGPFDGGPGGLDGNFPHPGAQPMDPRAQEEHDNYGDNQYHPSDAYGDLSRPYPEDTDQDPHAPYGGVPEHGGTLSPEDQNAYGVYGDEAQQHHDNFGGSDAYDEGDLMAANPADQDSGFRQRNYGREGTDYLGHRQAWAPVDHDNSVALPYDPTPQYPAIPGDTEGTLQPIHEIDADERLSPADSITFADRSDDESELEPTGPNFARSAAWGDYDPDMPPHLNDHANMPGGGGGYAAPLSDVGGYPSHHGTEADWEDAYPGRDPSEQYDASAGPGGDAYQGGYGGDPQQWYSSEGLRMDHDGEKWNTQPLPDHMANVHEAFAFLIPLAEGLVGAGAGAAAGGAAADAGMGAVGQGVARGVGSAGAHEMMGGEGGEDPGMGQQFVDATSPGEGWGELQKGASLDTWLSGYDQGGQRQLSAKYIDVPSGADYHNDPVAQFRHDPHAYIARLGHVMDEPVSQEMQHYGQLVEANATIREAAWSDVRKKAMRLRREGKVDVKDVAPDRIYASVEGDHGTYDVMIAKGGAYGGFGGGHTISNWRCACEWGKWAFQRRLTYVGRLCSHAYASYMEMQSSHMKNQPRQRKLTRPYTKRADALQNVPQRLVPELVVNDTEDSRQFMDVTKDQREDTGPDDIISDQDIVHFAGVLAACERENLPYPRQLVAFLERLGDDQTTQDWKVEDAGKAAGDALEDIRDWADTPASDSLGHMEERNDDVRDAVDRARDGGTDASALVAFRTAKPSDPDPYDSLHPDQVGNQPQRTQNPRGDVIPAANPNEYVPGGPAGRGSGAASTQGQADNQNNDYVSGGPRGGFPSGGDSGLNIGPAGQATGGDGGLNFGPAGQAPGAAAPAAPGAAPTAPGSAPATSGGSAGTTERGGRDEPATGQGQGTPGNGGIGQGEYKIQQGDTLSDIAQRSGYGGDYNSLAQQNNITNPDMINAGGTLNIGKPGGGTQTPPAANPAQTGSDAATPSSGVPSASSITDATPKVDLSAAGGSSSSGGGVDTMAVGTGAQAPATDTSSANSGAGSSIDTSSSTSGTSQPADAQRKSMNLFADRRDYDEWVRYAYPDGKADHQPFNGSGGDTSIKFTTSEEYADKARKDADDVTDLEHHNVNEVGGVKRAGKAPRRTVTPTVIREQRPNGAQTVNVQASMESFGNFDPLATRSPRDFDDDAAAVHMAASDDDIVAQFQRNAAHILGNSSSGGDSGFDIAGAANQFLQRTAGRNFSLAEQSELIREGDRGGAGNLDSLDLSGTHYDESMNSVGLF